MNRMFAYLVTITLGLWLGGLVALILFVSTLFIKARAAAIDAAPVLFHAFERYQLILAAVALLTLVIWRWVGRSKTKTWSLAATLIATGLAAVQIGYITPKIEAARNVDHATFDKFHHLASTNYTVLSVFVLIALILAITATRRELLLRLAAGRVA
ncbi:MAG: hypothetical protein JWM57_2350 [Phycisphaerales bacterium]|nr:hypothetical protein [Phycisphaerales bacterium]